MVVVVVVVVVAVVVYAHAHDRGEHGHDDLRGHGASLLLHLPEHPERVEKEAADRYADQDPHEQERHLLRPERHVDLELPVRHLMKRERRHTRTHAFA